MLLARSRVLSICGAVLVVSALVGSFQNPVLACCTRKGTLALVDVGGNMFHTYDFTSDTHSAGTSAGAWKVDFTVTVFFENNASKVKIEDAFWGAAIVAKTRHNFMKDGGTWFWDHSKGTKKDLFSELSRHMRLYAGDGGRIYSPGFGYWVVGTTHWDVMEFRNGESFGWSEQMENDVAAHAKTKPNWTVTEDAFNILNQEAPRWENNTFWYNNGQLTRIGVP